MSSPGNPLSTSVRTFFERRFGRDLSNVRVHVDYDAASAARLLGAAAFTFGSDLVFAAGRYQPGNFAGQKLLAHELAHVVQQQRGGAKQAAAPVVDSTGPAEREAGAVAAAMPLPRAPVLAAPLGIQRFEAGEHAQFGETGTELQALINAPASIHTVKTGGETLASIAAAYGVPQSDLRERNKSKIKRLPAPGHRAGRKKGAPIEGFAAGEQIEIPQVLNQPMRDALTTKELTFEAGRADAANKRATLTYGEGIAMGGDLFADPAQIDTTSKDKLERIQNLIQGEKTSAKGGTFVPTADWEAATDQRFTELALKNESHFSPSDPSLAPPTSAAGTRNNKTEWERYHDDALKASQGGDRNKALQINSFADHFLTDAFSAGHLINKLDVMQKFKGGIHTKGGKLTDDSVKFFDSIASQSFSGDVKALFSQYETVETHWGFHPNIDSVSMFSQLLQAVYQEEPGTSMVASAVAKAVHDELSTRAGGISVENQKGDNWQLSGDKALNAKTADPKTLQIGRKAVAQSQYNILSVFNLARVLDLPKLFKAVWDYVPRPTSAGAADVKAAVDSGTDPKQSTLVSRLVSMIKAEYRTILAKLVALKKLKKA